MTQKLEQWLKEIKRKHGRKKIWMRVIGMLMAVTVFATTYAKILPAITMNKTYCGIEEHIHSVEGGCYTEHKDLICTQEEGGHTHTEACYEEHNSLVCTLAEAEGHAHSDGCYDEEGSLICTLEEGEGHQHTHDCYGSEKVLVCGKEEGTAHEHTDVCYETTLELTCDKEEHSHGKACYSNQEADIETAAVWERSIDQVELTGVWADDVLAIADSQLGYKESVNNYQVLENESIKGYSRYGAWYGSPYGDWCAMFVSFCLSYAQVDRELMPIDANCGTWLDKLEELKIYHRTGNGDDKSVEGYKAPEEYTPEPADLIFFDWENDGNSDHVGLVYELIKDEEGNLSKVKTIEGNSADTVRYNTYDLTDEVIMGYGELPENPNPDKEPGKVGEEDDPEPSPMPEETDEITLSVETDNYVIVTMKAPKDAFDVPAEELSLSAVAIDDEKAKELLESEASANDGESVTRNTMLFDINVMHGDEIVQPNKPVQVSFSGINTPKNDAKVFHVDTEAEVVEEMTAEKEENGDITMEAPHFSIYGVTFTVDFHNGDVMFSIEGESEVLLSTIFEKLNIERSAADAVAVEFSDPTLISVEKDGNDWKLTSLQSFETEETLTITFADGEVYKIRVTDPPYVNDIPVLIPSNRIAVINENTNSVSYYGTLAAAMGSIGTGTDSYTVVFTSDYASTGTDWNAVASNGAQATKITFTSTYSNGSANVRSGFTVLGGTGTVHNLCTETEFKNIDLKYSGTPCIYANGHKLTMGKGITCPNISDYGMQLYGGSHNSNVADTDITVLSGKYQMVCGGGNYGSVTNSGSLYVGGTAEFYTISPTDGNVNTIAGSKLNMVVDGSEGAKAQIIQAHNNAAVVSGTVIEATIRDMKDIPRVDFYTNNSGSGKLTIEGDVQVQNRFYTNNSLTDVELAADATLTVGSNSDGSIAGTGAYSGDFYAGKDLIVNANSKLIFAGNNGQKTVMGNLKVQGADAEIDIFKSGTTTYPLYIKGTGDYIGTEKLKLGVHKDPNTAATTDTVIGDTLLSFDTADNAMSGNYQAGDKVEAVYKNNGLICVGKKIDDLDELNPPTGMKVAVINEATNQKTYYATLAAAMTYIGTGTDSYKVVFTSDYNSTAADWTAFANNGAQAKKITVTSSYKSDSGDVRSSLTISGDRSMSTETEFKHITFKYGNSYTRIYARGHKLTMGEGVACPAVAAGYEMQIYGGSNTSHVTTSDVTVLSGTYAYVFGGGVGYNVSGKANITIGGTASVNNATAGSVSSVTPATAKIDMTIDGSDGAKVAEVYSSHRAVSTSNNSAISADANINATIRNMKDIVVVDLYSYTSATGTLTIDGDVQVQNRFYTNNSLTDVELAADATLTVGSNSDGSIAGTGAYSGDFYAGKDLIVNANSKLIFAGNNAQKTVMSDLIVQGSDAEIDIFMSGNVTYPLNVKGTGHYVGAEKLKLGVNKAPNVSGSGSPSKWVLMNYAVADNAKVENYTPGNNVPFLSKDGGNIVVDPNKVIRRGSLNTFYDLLLNEVGDVDYYVIKEKLVPGNVQIESTIEGVSFDGNHVFYNASYGKNPSGYFKLTYKDGAIDKNGKYHNVSIIVSDLQVSGSSQIFYHDDKLGPALDSSTNFSSVRDKVEISIEGAVPGETYIWGCVQLDIYDGSPQEQMKVISGAKSPAYIPTSNWLRIINEDGDMTPTANGLNFIATAYDEDKTYNSGFVIVADAHKLEMAWGGQVATTYLFSPTQFELYQYSVEIKKEVEDPFFGANDDKFEFNVEITRNNTNHVPQDGDYKVYDKNGQELTRNIVKDPTGSFSIELGDGEKIVINKVPGGYFCKVKEKPDSGYSTKHTINNLTAVPGHYCIMYTHTKYHI